LVRPSPSARPAVTRSVTAGRSAISARVRGRVTTAAVPCRIRAAGRPAHPATPPGQARADGTGRSGGPGRRPPARTCRPLRPRPDNGPAGRSGWPAARDRQHPRSTRRRVSSSVARQHHTGQAVPRSWPAPDRPEPLGALDLRPGAVDRDGIRRRPRARGPARPVVSAWARQSAHGGGSRSSPYAAGTGRRRRAQARRAAGRGSRGRVPTGGSPARNPLRRPSAGSHAARLSASPSAHVPGPGITGGACLGSR